MSCPSSYVKHKQVKHNEQESLPRSSSCLVVKESSSFVLVYVRSLKRQTTIVNKEAYTVDTQFKYTSRETRMNEP